eukprot:357274-Chlamydomonas_euryale.AAC.13
MDVTLHSVHGADDDDLRATRRMNSVARQNMETTQGRRDLGATRRHGGGMAIDNSPTYAFCSSSMYSNIGGQTYQQSSTARMGPGRVRAYLTCVAPLAHSKSHLLERFMAETGSR